MIKKITTLLFLTAVLLLPIAAQDSEPADDDDYIGIVSYGEGEQIFSLNGGLIFPLFNIAPFYDATAGETLITSIEGTNMGFGGSLKWGAFVQDNLLLGVEFGGIFASTENRTLTMIPISFITAYYFIFYPFEFPIYINTGLSLNTLDDYFRITALIKPGISAYWNINGEWSLGLNCEYWLLPEFYFDEYMYQSRISNFLQLNISAVYHF